jgi:hypothetical protein
MKAKIEAQEQKRLEEEALHKAEIEAKEQRRLEEEALRKAKVEANAKAEKEKLEMQGKIVVLNGIDAPDNPNAKVFYLRAEAGDTIELVSAVRANHFVIFYIGKNEIGKYRDGIVPAQIPFLISNKCSKDNLTL